MSEPQAGNHADLYEIEQRIAELTAQLRNAGIAVEELFCDLDAGFDGKDLRSALVSHGMISNVSPNPRNGGESTEEWIYDEERYQERWKIERTNAWMDSNLSFTDLIQLFPVGKDGTSLPLLLFSLKL